MTKEEFKRTIKYLINHGCADIACKECFLNTKNGTPENDLCKAIICANLFIWNR